MRLVLRRGRRRGHTGLSVHRDEEADRPAGSLGMAHEGMSMLSTEDGGDLLVTLPPCDIEGCCARRESPPSTSSLHVPLPLCKQLHTSRVALLCRMHGGTPIPAIPHAPSCSTSSPTTSACPQMIYSPPVASAAPLYSGGAEPQSGSLGLAAQGRRSRLSAGGSPRFGRDVLGNSLNSPSALLWPSEWGPHCFCRPDLTHGAEAAAAPPWPDCKECAAVSLLAGRP